MNKNFNSIEEIVRARHSVRNFTEQRIDGIVSEELQREINKCNEESSLNIQLVLNEEKAFGRSHYGNFQNCKNYIVIMGDKRDKTLEIQAGYYGERIALKAVELGLNTCWVALTYKKSEVPCVIKDNERIIIIIAVGYGVTNGVEHKGKVFKEVSATSESKCPEWYKKGIEYALLAPTAINQQKFKFELFNNNEVSLKISGFGVCTKIDLGIVKYHFELGAGIDNFKWID